MIHALLFCVLTAQTDPQLAGSAFDKHVSLTCRAEPAAQALKSLSDAGGVSLQAAGLIQPEIVLLKLTDIPLREVLERLARASGGIWTREGDRYYLTRKPDFEATLAKREYAFELKRFTKVLADARHGLEAQKPFDDSTAHALARQIMKMENDAEQTSPPGVLTVRSGKLQAINEIRNALPGSRFMDRLVDKLTPEMLAAVPPGERRVFSTTPTQMELQLNLNLQAAADQFSKEQATWNDIAAREIHPPAGGYYHFYNMLQRGPDDPGKSTQVSRVVMNVERQMNSSAIFVTAYMLNSSGQEVSRSVKSINLVDVPAPTNPANTTSKSPPLTLTKFETQLAMSAQAADRTLLKQDPQCDPEVIAAAQHPEAHEPLASYVSSLLLQATGQQGLNLIADVPDAFLTMLAASAGFRPETAETLMRRIHGEGLFMEDPVRVDKTCLEVDGGAILGSRRFRTKRQPLAALLSSNPGGDPPLDLSLGYILSGGLRSYDYAYRSLRYAACSLPPPSTNQFVHFGQILAMIHAPEAGQPLHSFEIPLSRLDPDTLNAIVQLVYYQEPYLRQRVQLRAGGGNFVPHFPGIQDDPCEMFPNGLPPNGTVKLTLASGLAVQEAPPPKAQFFRLDRDISILGDPESPNLFRRKGQEPAAIATPTFRTFTAQIAHFTINLTPEEFTGFDFQMFTQTSKGYLPVNQLPQEVQDAMKRAGSVNDGE